MESIAGVETAVQNISRVLEFKHVDGKQEVAVKDGRDKILRYIPSKDQIEIINENRIDVYV